MVPERWQETNLRNLTTLITKGATPTTYGHAFIQQSNGAVRFIGAYNCSFTGKFRSDPSKWISDDANRMLKRSALAEGDSVLCIVGNTIGSSFQVSRDCLPANINQNVALIRPDYTKVDNDFLHFQLRSAHVQWQVTQEASVQAQPSLSLQQVGSFLVKAPILISEQKKIAKILLNWDKAIEIVEKLIEGSQQKKKAFMQQLLTGKNRFPGFNGEWKELPLNHVCSISKGSQLNRIVLTASGDFPVINGGVDPSGYTDSSNCPKNTITISEGGNSCGYVNFIRQDFWCGGHCYALLSLKIDRQYLYHFLKSNEHQIMRLRVGSGLPNIQKKAIEGVKIRIPEITEQKKIASALDASDSEISSYFSLLGFFKHQKKALMQQLLTGKKRVVF